MHEKTTNYFLFDDAKVILNAMTGKFVQRIGQKFQQIYYEGSFIYKNRTCITASPYSLRPKHLCKNAHKIIQSEVCIAADFSIIIYQLKSKTDNILYKPRALQKNRISGASAP